MGRRLLGGPPGAYFRARKSGVRFGVGTGRMPSASWPAGVDERRAKRVAVPRRVPTRVGEAVRPFRVRDKPVLTGVARRSFRAKVGG